MVDAVHARGATVAAHGTGLANCKLAAESAVDTLEHGFTIDADVARLLAENRVTVVSTLSVLRSWQGFATTTTVDRFTTARRRNVRGAAGDRRGQHQGRARRGRADRRGQRFGGGSVRAGRPGLGGGVPGGRRPGALGGARAATWRGGDVLGDARRRAGSRVGDPADFTVVHGDPLTEPAALWRVWHVQ